MNPLTLGRHLIERLGTEVISGIDGVGRMTNYLMRYFYWQTKPPFRIRLIFDQLYFIGNKSLFIICLAGSFTGAVMAYQTYFGFKLINVDSLVGPVVAITLAKELGPVLAGLIVAGRAGAAMAAQIGTMKVTEQVDALEVMGINSVQYLAVPRILATTLALPMLAAIFMFVGNFGSWVVGTKALLIDEAMYFFEARGIYVSSGHLAGAYQIDCIWIYYRSYWYLFWISSF
ncbi:MAG: ABC transporter permease [Halobacteriovoraceae bacterium]|nr:ABC transporter permease [Halobacteriovoraceae bacterium]